MKYHFKIHKEGAGFWAECIELPGCLTEGNSKEELFANMQDALNTYLEEPHDSRYVAPLPKARMHLSRNLIEVPVDPAVALAFSIRRQRIKNGLTQKEAADQLGMKQVYSYQRLEKRCNPSFDLLYKLASLFPLLSFDRVLR